jgi:hypothetical protein
MAIGMIILFKHNNNLDSFFFMVSEDASFLGEAVIQKTSLASFCVRILECKKLILKYIAHYYNYFHLLSIIIFTSVLIK